MKDIEITQEMIHKWGSYGLLENSKNYHNLIFAYEYSANELLISDNLFDFNNIGTYIFPILYRVFNKFSITLNQDFIKSKINIILKEFEFEFNRYMIQNDNLRGEFDLEATFCLQFSREHHFNIIL